MDPIYVLSGDATLVARFVADLTDQLVTPATRAFNHDVFEAKAAGAAAILNAARTVPMMAKMRLVVARDVETMGAEGMTELIPYLDKPSPTTVLVLTAGKVDARLKFFAAAKKKGMLRELEAPRQAQLPAWIRNEAQGRGAKFGEDAARRLAEVVGPDLGRLVSAVDQLALYAGDRPVTAADVDELIAETREKTVFELSDAVGRGERERALRAVARLFEQKESSVGLAMILARHIRQLALVRELTSTGTPIRDLPRAVGFPPFLADGLVAQARRFTGPGMTRAFQLLAAADRNLKGPLKQALGERIVVEKLVTDLVELAGG
jgi:DNA polymerase-3 subunit delta